MLGILVDIGFTNTTTVSSDPWVWQDNNYDSRWMRVLGPMFTAWVFCLLYVVGTESGRLSRLAECIDSVDLLELGLYQPLTISLAERLDS